MKVAILISILIYGSRVFGLCLPDSLESKQSDLDDVPYLENIAQSVHENFIPHLGQDLVIVFQPLNPRINAEIKMKDNQLVLELFGGMLTHSRMNEHSFQLLLCHELGHALGGPPLKSKTGWSSTEGQSDYYSGQTCARLLGMDEATFIQGALDLTAIYAEVMREPYPQLELCEEIRVERTNYGYPTVQCRLETMMAGWKNEARPRCWFKE